MTMRCRLLLVSLLVLAPAGAGRAEVKQAAPGGLLVEHVVVVKAAPDAVFKRIGDIGRWWNSSHSWSGDARNLSIGLEAGACFCEKWTDGSAEHGRVVMAVPGRRLRLHAALGPLQEMALSGALTFELAPVEAGTRLTVSYRVSGDPSHGLDKLAPVVDQVIVEQATGLARYAETAR